MANEETKKEVAEPKEKVDRDVKFTADQLELVNQMISKAVRSSAMEKDSGVSVYGQRDPKSIETVNVKRFNGKFVIGFKDLQDDPLKNVPKYVKYQFDPIRKLNNQPFVTLLLSNDGEEVEEKEVLLSDYCNERENYKAQVVEVEVKKEIVDQGYLGTPSVAREIDGKGNVLARAKVKAESVKEVRKFHVELPGFKGRVSFIDDFLA